MELGNFSVSLAVKDLERSEAFYQKLGFKVIGGERAHKFLIMRNGAAKIGLFQGMFERNLLTFNPGWDEDGHTLESFADVREIRDHLAQQGIEAKVEIASDSGPGNLVVIDPDGNPILIDQHV